MNKHSATHSRWLSLVLALSLLLQTSGVLLAQDDAAANEANSTVFMPMVAAHSARQASTTTEGPVAPADGVAPSLMNRVSLTKDEVNAAARGVDNLAPVSLIVRMADAADPSPIGALPGVRLVHRYTKVFNGVSLITTAGQLDQIRGMAGVAEVYVDQLLKPATEVSPEFIGAPIVWGALGGQESAGEGVVVGILDTGIWPEHASVADPDPAGKPYEPPPVTPGANGFGAGGERSTCDFGNREANPADEPFTCNNKLIGAYNFMDTYKAFIGLLPEEFDSARDDNGHGTHTATTAAGNAGVSATLFGVDRGIVSGVAPRAHIIAFRVCGDLGCFQSDSVAAIEQAMLDGVNAVNFSIGGGGSPYSDPVELAFLAAYEAGVFVAASAGNSGPGPNTVEHNGPWVTTVAASTSNRHFLAQLTLVADNGDTLELTGATVTTGIAAPMPVVFAPEPLCIDLPEEADFTGQIVICDRGVIARVAKSFNVAQRNAAGLILRNRLPQGLNTDNHFIPSIHLDSAEGDQLGAFMETHTGVMATFTGGVATPVPGDAIASFSSRGGPGQLLGVGKPDVTAPGVQILAGHTPQPATETGGLPGELFQAIQGTSMSSPHVAGAAALLKALHPDWSPGQIKSALMMTARTAGVTKEDGVTPASAYDHGAGRIDLSRAGDPGLTLDEQAGNFVGLRNELWNANYPSIYIPVMPGSVTVRRTVKDVTGSGGVWQVTTSTDGGNWVLAAPERLVVAANGEATFDITIRGPNVPLGQTRFGQIHLTDGQRQLHIPVTFVRGQAPVAVTQRCAPGIIGVGNVARCQIEIQNTAFITAEASLTTQIDPSVELIPSSVSGGRVYDARTIKTKATLFPQQPPLVTVAVDPTASPAGYLGLSQFPGNTVVDLTDESIVNFIVPPYLYAGELYNQIGIVSNGYLVAGGGTESDVIFANFAPLPSPTAPNNILAPFWTDLNPEAGGQVLVNFLTDGVSTWMIIEYEQTPNFTSSAEINTFQVWIGVDGVEDISFTYGPDITGGDGGDLTVGAENKFGNSGGMVYFNGDGEAPSPSYPNGEYEVKVRSVPGEPGAKRTVSYSVRGVSPGYAGNCARVTSDVFQGVAIACGKLRVR